MNIATNLEQSALFFPGRAAVREGGREMTYAELNERANRVATGLIKMGLEPGQFVALCAPNSAEWIVFYFGVLKAGGVAVTLSAQLMGDELRNLVTHAKPKFIYIAESKLPEMEKARAAGGVEKVICEGGDISVGRLMELGTTSFSAVKRERTDTAAILYTGGTTGVPKGALLKHEGVLFSAYSIAYYERSTQNDLALCFLPFNHVFGQMHIMNSTIFSSGCLELLPAFDMDQVLDILKEGRVTKFFSVPTIYIRLLSLPDLKDRLGPLRYCFSAGASMALEIVKRWKERTGITIAESYGMTECMPITFNHFYPDKHVAGTVGQSCYGVEVEIRDVQGKTLGAGRTGRNLREVARSDEGVPEQPRRDGLPHLAGRLAQDGRHRRLQPPRLSLHSGPPQRPRHNGRRERLPQGGGGGALRLARR